MIETAYLSRGVCDTKWPRDDCPGPSDTCPLCNVEELPEMPPDFRRLIDSKE